MNPLIQQQPQGAPAAPSGQASPEEIAKGHELADTMLGHLMELAQTPRGQLTKQKVFQSAADMMAKGLFADPQSRVGFVTQLTQLPEDEGALRQALGKEIMQIASFKQNLDAHAAQGQAPAGGMPGG